MFRECSYCDLIVNFLNSLRNFKYGTFDVDFFGSQSAESSFHHHYTHQAAFINPLCPVLFHGRVMNTTILGATLSSVSTVKKNSKS